MGMLSGVGVKGGSASRTRSAAAGEHGTGERPAQRTLDAGVAAHALGCWGGWTVFNPPRLPHGQCGVWGRAPWSLAEGGCSSRSATYRPSAGRAAFGCKATSHQRSAKPSAVTLTWRSLPWRSACSGVSPPSEPLPEMKKCHFVKLSRPRRSLTTALSWLRSSVVSAKKLGYTRRYQTPDASTPGIGRT